MTDRDKLAEAFIEIGTDDTKLKRGLTKARQAAEREAKSMSRTLGAISTIGSAAAMEKLGKDMAKVTGRMVEMVDQIRQGKVSTTEAILEVGKELPVLEGIVRTGADIHELFTGDKQAIKEANEELAQMDRFMGTIKEQGLEVNGIFEGWGRTLEQFRRQAERDTMTPDRGARAEVDWKLRDTIAQLNQKRDEDKAAIERQIQELVKQRNSIHVPPDPGEMPKTGGGLTVGDVTVEDSGAVAAWQEANDRRQRALAQRRLIQGQIDRRNQDLRKVDSGRTDAVAAARDQAKLERSRLDLEDFFGGIAQEVASEEEALGRAAKDLDEFWAPIEEHGKRLSEEAERAAKAMAEARADAERAAESVKDAVATPEERLRKHAAEVSNLYRQKLLTRDQARASIAQERAKLFPAPDEKPAKEPKPAPEPVPLDGLTGTPVPRRHSWQRPLEPVGAGAGGTTTVRVEGQEEVLRTLREIERSVKGRPRLGP